MLSRFDSIKIAREAQGDKAETQFTKMIQELQENKTAEYILMEKVMLLCQTLEDPESFIYLLGYYLYISVIVSVVLYDD